jgi:membrane-bound metal-dependent hydrolase YbcI (DUF457 family)
VASPITHAFIGAALPASAFGRKAGLKITLVSIVCSISPDFDKVAAKLLERFFAVALSPIWSHRGISHSFLFALVFGFLATSLAVRRRWSSERRHTLFVVFFCVTTRYLHPIAAISSISFWQYFTPALGPVLLQEVLWIWLPFSILFVLIRVTASWTGNPKQERGLMSRPLRSAGKG